MAATEVQGLTLNDTAIPTAVHDTASDDSQDDDAMSETSTLLYGHEPFETYQDRVRELVSTLWPDVFIHEVEVERMLGGDLNRVTGFSFYTTQDNKKLEYVLRTRRAMEGTLADDLTSLRFLEQYTDVPAPKTVLFDTTVNNCLREPYMVQERIPDQAILHAYSGMSHECRLSAARQHGQLLRKMMSIKADRIGKLALSDETLSEPWSSNIRPVDMSPPVILDDHVPISISCTDHTIPYTTALPPADTQQALLKLLNRHRGGHNQEKDTLDLEYDDKFITMTHELGETGYFIDHPITLCHLDFQPQNIFVDPNALSDPITTVLDWDSAVFVPVVMGCEPPMWLWAWKQGEDEDEREANNVPGTPEQQEIKKAFEEAAGPIYMRLAYGATNRLVRRLIRFGLKGMYFSEDYPVADEMLEEWAIVREELSGMQSATTTVA